MKKLAKKALSDAKRDLVQTGNKQLRTSTVRTIQSSESLLALRKNMGPTASGFQSKYCSDANQLPAVQREMNAVNVTSQNQKANVADWVSDKLKRLRDRVYNETNEQGM